MSDSYVFIGNPSITIKAGKECLCTIDKKNNYFECGEYTLGGVNCSAKIIPPISDWTVRDGLMYDIGKIILEELEKNNE